MLPETLYKFVSLDTAQKILGNMTIRYTPLPELNDAAEAPVVFQEFDGLHKNGLEMLRQVPEVPISERDSVARMLVSGFLMAQNQAICKKFGILCLTAPESLTSHLMWSHYADHHKGIAIGFKSSTIHLQGNAGLRQVDYELASPTPPTSRYIDMIYRKHGCWSYEQEHRSWKHLPVDSREASQFVSISAEDITEIILGCRSESGLVGFISNWVEKHNARHITIKRCLLENNLALQLRSVTIPSLKVMHETIEQLGPEFQADIDQDERDRQRRQE